MKVRWVDALHFEPTARRPQRPAVVAPSPLGPHPVVASRKALILEVAGVLYDDSAWQRWLFQQLARIGLRTQYVPFFQVFERDFLPAVYVGRDYWEALREFLTASGLRRGQVDEMEAAGRSRYHQLELEVRLLPGVATTLSQLQRQNVPMVLLCNSQYRSDELVARLQSLGLVDRFAAVLSSRDTGACLPAAAGYEAALDTLRLSSREVAFLGRQQVELSGAQRIGLATIAINYQPGTRADLLLDRFNQLPQVIALRQPAANAG